MALQHPHRGMGRDAMMSLMQNSVCIAFPSRDGGALEDRAHAHLLLHTALWHHEARVQAVTFLRADLKQAFGF